MLRLTDGVHSGSGRLEIYHDGEWGSICDDSFDITDADVACRQIGYAESLRILSTSDDYTRGTCKCYDNELECIQRSGSSISKGITSDILK